MKHNDSKIKYCARCNKKMDKIYYTRYGYKLGTYWLCSLECYKKEEILIKRLKTLKQRRNKK